LILGGLIGLNNQWELIISIFLMFVAGIYSVNRIQELLKLNKKAGLA